MYWYVSRRRCDSFAVPGTVGIGPCNHLRHRFDKHSTPSDKREALSTKHFQHNAYIFKSSSRTSVTLNGNYAKVFIYLFINLIILNVHCCLVIMVASQV